MNKRWVIRLLAIITGGIIAFAAVGLVIARPRSNSASTTPSLSISLLGFTNDTRGARLVVFSVSNAVPRLIGYSTAIEFKERGAWQPPASRRLPTTRVAAHQISSFSVTNPIEGIWRVSVLYELTPTRGDQLGFSIRRFFYRLNLKSVASRIPTEKFKAYTVDGPEMTD